MSLPSKYNLFKLFLKYPLYFRYLGIKKIRMHKRYQWIKANISKSVRIPSPLEYSIKLTNKCNLRCSTCAQWGIKGWHRFLSETEQQKELDWDILMKIFTETANARPFYTFYGGEPFLYSKFKELLQLINKSHCFSCICTNGLYLSEYKNYIERNPYLTFIIFLDGLENENDKIRGAGSYATIVENIKIIKNSRKHSPYLGIEFKVLPHNVHIMSEFGKEMVKIGVDWIIFNQHWFITDIQKDEYEDFLIKNLAVKPITHLAHLDSRFDLDRDSFINEYKKIENMGLPIQIVWQPPISDPNQINDYLDLPQVSLASQFCRKHWIRADILPNAKITACKEFPDFMVGDLYNQSIPNIWNSYKYQKFRNLISEKLLPVCAKCDGVNWYVQ